MTVQIYRSSDASAPTLNGNSGSLVGLLDAVLVNGYGSKTALGWTKSYAGTNKASYKQPTGSNGFYLDVDDSTSDFATGSARVRGYETMSALGTGTNPFPTIAQIDAAHGIWVKSQEASAGTAVSWVVVGTNKMFFLWIQTVSTFTNGATGAYGPMFCFGDILSYKSGDAYNTIIQVANGTSAPFADMHTTNIVATAISGLYTCRSYLQTGTSITTSRLIDSAKSGGGTTIGGSGTIGSSNPNTFIQYPNPVDSNFYMSPIWAGEPVGATLRGQIPGVYAPLHWFPLITGSQIAGTGSFTGKTFEAFTLAAGSAGASGQVLLEVSNTW